jgi:acetoin:2,6-dichlorophenolindophenol oxidoreductase subunit beta
MAIPGLKVVAPSNPIDVIGLTAAAVRDPDPVAFFDSKALYSLKADIPGGEVVEELGVAKVLRTGTDLTLVALASTVPKALEGADILDREYGISAEVVDPRSLVPLDMSTILESVRKTNRLFTVEENPRLLGWGAEIASLVAEEAFFDLEDPIVRITTPHIPLPQADVLEDAALPSVDRVVETVRKTVG